MERLPYEVVSTIFRKAILHYLVITGQVFPTKLSKDLGISKGLSSGFLRLCNALGVVKRERNKHKVLYSLTGKGVAVLKRLAPEIFDLSFSEVFETLSKSKFSTKHYPLAKLGFRIEYEEDNFKGVTFYFYDYDNNLLGTVYRNSQNIWWCSICKKEACKHIDYAKKLYNKLKNIN